MFKTTEKLFQSTGGFVPMRFGGLSLDVVLLLVFVFYVKIAQMWCSTRKDLKQIGSGHT